MALFKRKPRYARSDNYRTNFIRENPGVFGLYMCSYCGRIIPRRKMEVDHIISINHANNHKLLHFIGKSAINSTVNLTPACHNCNSNKSDRGGLWIIRGLIGWLIHPMLWILFIILVVNFLKWIFIYQIN